MRLGIDSYSYHRLLGELRRGEDPPDGPFENGSLDVVAEARRLGVEIASLETCFLEPPDELDAAAYLAEADGLELALAWGHPAGLVWGRDEEALADLLAWIGRSPDLRCRLVRMVVASKRHLEEPGWLGPTAAAIDQALDAAEAAGVELVVENHADLTVDSMEALLEACPTLGVCFDTANAFRMGDDPVDAARRLAPHVRMLHFKDVESTSNDEVSGPRSVAYGTGVVDVDGVLDAFGDRLDDLPVCVELGQLGPGNVDERAMVEECLAWLRARNAR